MEPLIVVSTWKRNSGSTLVLVASIICLATCVLWYSDLLPKIELIPSSSIQDLRLERRQRPPNTLVLTMVAPSQLPASPINGVIEIHPTFGNLTVSEPIMSEPFVLTNDGVESLAISQLQSGDYSLLVYLDENNNNRLDTDEQGQPTEVYRTARSPDRRPESLQNEAATVQLKPGSPLYLTFFFEEFAVAAAAEE